MRRAEREERTDGDTDNGNLSKAVAVGTGQSSRGDANCKAVVASSMRVTLMSNQSGSLDFGPDDRSRITPSMYSADRTVKQTRDGLGLGPRPISDGEGERTTTMTAVADGWRDVTEVSRASR